MDKQELLDKKRNRYYKISDVLQGIGAICGLTMLISLVVTILMNSVYDWSCGDIQLIISESIICGLFFLTLIFLGISEYYNKKSRKISIDDF